MKLVRKCLRILALLFIVLAVLWTLFTVFVGVSTKDAIKVVELMLNHSIHQRYDEARDLYTNPAISAYTPDGYFETIVNELELSSEYQIQWQKTSLQKTDYGVVLEIRGDVLGQGGKIKFVSARLEKSDGQWRISCFRVLGGGNTEVE